MIRYLIIDDEHVAHEIIKDYCGNLPELDFTKSCFNALEARQYLTNHSVDLIFLDLNLPKLKGFEFLRTINSPPKIIVTTAYEEYALEGFELNVIDYLLKPFSFQRFLKAIDKLTPENEANTSATNKAALPGNQKAEKIFVREDKKYQQINLSDILYAEARGNYTKLVLADREIVTRQKISALGSLLSDKDFIQVHKSFIVAKKHIESIEGNRIFIREHIIPIGKVYRLNINKMLNE